MNLIEFLRETKTALSSGFQQKAEVHVVIGNESCDLDSAVCSVVLAYFLTLTSDSKDVVFIPVLDIPQQKYHLRTETTFLLRHHGISDELLTFNDQIDLDDLHRQCKLKLSLVDHNILPEKYIQLDECVVSVTDHRPQVRKQDNRVKINIAKVGSCATLVAEEVLKKTDLTFDPTALTFLYGAILIDTVNLSPAAHKMTDQDVSMADKLKEMLPEVNGDELYNTIQKAKTDISELTTLELLEKDLKIVSGNSIKVAMSSVSIGLQDFLSRENLMEDLSSFVQSRSVLAVIVMMIHEVTEGEPVRDIAVYSTEMALQQKICDQLSANKDPVLELTVVTTNNHNLTCYKQGCVRASRKVVLPIIQTIVNDYEKVISHCEEQSNSAEKPLDSIDLFNLSGDQTSQNQFAASVPLDNFDLLNFAGQQSSQSQSETGTNQNLVDEFDIFTGTDSTNNAQINNTDVFNGSPLDSQNQLDLNFDLVGTSEQISQFDSSSNIDLLGGFDPFSSSSNNTPIIVNNLPSNIPEINIDSEQATDEFNEADIMFGSQTLETPHSGMNSVSQGSSAHNSEPGSAFASYPITPPNSFIDSTGHAHVKEFVLPSLNSAEMLEKIREKKGRLRSTESTSADGTENDPNSVPYTPSNSYMDGAFDQYAKDHQLPSFNSMEMVQRIKQKRSSMEMSRLDEEDDNIVRLRSESGEVTPFTPHNSYRDLSLLEKNSKTFLDTNKLHQTLRNIEDDASETQQEADEDSLAVKEITDSGLLMFDTSDMLNPTDIDNNVVAVGIAQEMVKRETTSEDLLVSFFDAPSDGGSRLTDSSSSSFDGKSINDSAKGSNNDNNFQNVESKGGNADHLQTEDLVLHQSINEFAQNLTDNLIEDAINSFPENELPTEIKMEESTAISPVSIEENYFKENKNFEILESPSSTGSVSTPEEVPVETDYLSSVDPMLGNLDLVKASEEKEIVESISFRKISGEEPQTVRQELLLRNTPDKVDEDTEPKVEEFNEPEMEEWNEPTMDHSNEPKIEELNEPTMDHSNEPTMVESNEPKMEESKEPTMEESNEPTMEQSNEPEMVESNEPKMEESKEPTMEESNEPEMVESNEPKIEEINELKLEEPNGANDEYAADLIQHEPKMEEFNETKMDEFNEPKMEEFNEPMIDYSNEPKIEETDEPMVDHSNEPKIVEFNEPEIEDFIEPVMVESNEPKMDGLNEHKIEESNEPMMDHSNEPKMEECDEPEIVESNEPKIEVSIEPEFVESYEPEMEKSNEMEDSNKPEMDHSNEPKMEDFNELNMVESNEPEMEEPSEPKMDEPNGAIDEYAAELIQHVISGAIATVTTATTTVTKDIVSDCSSDITEESGVTWSRETSFDTVSSIPSKDGQTVIWSNQGSLDTPRSSIDKNSGAASLESDELLLLAQSAKNGQMSSFETQESNDYLSSTSSSKLSSDSKVESSEKIEERSVTDLITDEGHEKELVQSSFNNQSDALLDFSAGSNLDQLEGNQISKQTLLNFEGSELIQAESLKSEDGINEQSNVSDRTTVGMESIEKMESVDISSENEAENLSPLKSDNAFDELSSIFDKPAVGIENLDKMESVEMSSENEAENLFPLKSDNAFDELSNTFHEPTIGTENLDKMKSVEMSSENEAENLSPLKSDNAFDELSSIFDKPAVGMKNLDKIESVEMSSEIAENLLTLKSDNAFDELSSNFDEPTIGIENLDKMESVDYISSENEAENSFPMKSDNAFDELSNIFDKPAVGIENTDKMKSVEMSSETEAENFSLLKSNYGFDELNSTFDKTAIGTENLDKMESVEMSSENKAENLSTLKSDNAFDELSNIFDKPAVGIENLDKMESVDYISSENEVENSSPLKSDNAFDELSNIFNKPAVGIENTNKKESVEMSSENLSPLKTENAVSELSNILDKPAIGIENLDKMESVEISSENEAENLSPLKSDNAFDELSNIFDKPAFEMENKDKMESVDYISSENETENLSSLKSDNAFDELSNIFDKPPVGMENLDKIESVEMSSENLSPLKTENAVSELSNIFDKPAIGIENIDKRESVEISSENEAENLSSSKSDNAFDELSNIFNKPAIGMGNKDKMESVEMSSENEPENLLSMKSDNTFDELSSILDKTAIGTENMDKMESVEMSSENEAENLSTLKSDNAFDELSNIFDKTAVGIENTDKIESISSEIEAENLSPLKSENVDFLDQSQDSVPYSDRKKESLDYISSEGETDNYGKLQDEAEASTQDARSTYHKAETLDYISSEGEGNDTEFVQTLQGMYSSQSSEQTSTTTEGSYQVLSPDQQIKDIKEEITDLINSEIKGEVTDMISDIKMELSGLNPDVFETKENENIEFYAEVTEIDENETDLNKHKEEFISGENLPGGVAEQNELKGDNLDSNISSNELVVEVNETDEIKTDLNKQDDEFISNQKYPGAVAENELRGDNLDFSNILSNEHVGEVNEVNEIKENETGLNKQDTKIISNENLLGREADGSKEELGELKGDNIDFSNDSSNELVGDRVEINEDETDLNKQDKEVVSNNSLLDGATEGLNEEHVELKGDNLKFTNNSSNELVSEGVEIDENETEPDLINQDSEIKSNENLLGAEVDVFNKEHGEIKGDNLEFTNNSSNELLGAENDNHNAEVMSNANILGVVVEDHKQVNGELQGDNLEFSINSSYELVCEQNEVSENITDLNKHDGISKEKLLGTVTESSNEVHGELKGSNLEFSINSSYELVCEQNEVSENITDLNKHDGISKEKLLGTVTESSNEVNGELKGSNLEFSNNSLNELGDGNEISENETETDLNTHDEELNSNGNLLSAVAEDVNEVHDELKGDNFEFTNNSLNEFVDEINKIDENETETDLNKQDEELISNENLQGAKTEGFKIEHDDLKGDNSEKSNTSSNNSHTKISETCVIDENGINSNENGAIDSIKRTKEIYMTSAGRISIASDGDSENTKQRFSVTDNFIEETHNEEDLKETQVETVAHQLSVENEPITVSKEPENISVETESKSEEPVGTLEDLVNDIQEPVSKSEEPVNKTKELVSELKEPVSKLEEPVSKTQEPVGTSGEPENKTKEPVSKLEEPSVKQQEKTDEGTEKPKVVKPVKKAMDMTEEWHEDPIPGMGVTADNDSDSSDSRSRHSSGDSDSSDSTRPANRPTSLQTTRKKKKISANFNILKEDYASPDDIDTTENPGDLEWENDTPVSIPKEPIAEYSAEDEYQDAKHWRGVEINGKQQKIDLKVIDPYKKVLTHGGYYGDGLNAIIVFSGCYLPDRSRKDYNYVMDNLFLYVISTLELLVAEDYMIVYFHGATPRRQMPSFGWLKKCYQMIDRRLKKNLKGLLLIHPTLWLRTIVLMTKPFISSKFSSKLKFVRTLHDLSNIVPVDYIYIPDQVKKYDSLLQHRSPAHSSSSSTPHTPS